MRTKSTILIIILLQTFLKAQQVNQFTGAFNYNVPILNLPSERGPGINIDASYNSGIQMNQPASQIGLGWSLNAGGAIYRQVSGFPDDMLDYEYMDMINNKQIKGQGAMYLTTSGLSGAIDYDFVKTQKGPAMDTAEFTTPAFDIFNVNGPAFGGKMKLSYLKFYSYHSQNMGTNSVPEYKMVPNTQNLTANSFPGSGYFRKPQFHFTGDFADTLVSRHYSTTVNSSTPFRIPSDLVSQLGYPGGSSEPFIGKHLNGTAVSNQNYDLSTGRLASSNFVEYFTNQDINSANNSGFASGPLTTFIDFSSSHARSSSNFPDDGIGYFRITASNGLTYHYALPVYESQSCSFSAPLNYNYSLPTCLSGSLNPYGTNNSSQGLPITGSNIWIKYTNANRYAVKWLLTAVTGRDFVDINNNHMVDDGDDGYWISYDYQLWNSNQIQRSPYYGYDHQYSPDEATEHYPIYYPIEPLSTGAPYKLSGVYGTASISKTEEYYLKKIRSSSHTAIFVMDSRKDEKGGDVADISVSTFKPAPSLLIKRIILFKNEQMDSIIGVNPPSFSQSNYSNNSLFDFSQNINTSSTFFTEAWYQLYSNNWKYCILKNVEFDQDYSLCPKYHGNIEVKCNGADPLTSPSSVQAALSVGNYSSSGKLTLKRILTYDFQNIKLTPSTIFDYQSNLTNGNPDFNPIKTDNWGYFKSDASNNGYSRYTTATSKDYTKAWSLNKITDPLGGITEVEYESNSYKKVIDIEKGTRGPVFIYRIQDVDTLHSYFAITMEEGSNASYPMSEFQALSTNTLTGIKRSICMPFVAAINPSTPSGTIIPYTGFAMGDCTFTVNTTNSGYPTNHVMGNITSSNNAVYNSTNSRMFSSTNIDNYLLPTIHSSPYGSYYYDMAYSGNGFLMIETPIGFEAFGGGVRVKNIKTQNSTNEIYVEQYSYENGVAGNEMDRFDFQVQKTGCAGSLNRYDFIKPKSYTLFDMLPTIGYTKVTVKDLGRINTANGKTETTFITDPADENGAFSNNYSANTFTNVLGSSDQQKISEFLNQFSSVFGAVKQTIVYDKNDNQISKTVNEYEATQQGALSEVIHFEDPYYFNGALQATVLSSTVNILRDIPVVQKSTTHYGMGTVNKVETLRRDELTGESTTIRNSGINKSTSIAYKIPAYKQYLPIESLDFTNANSRKMIPFGEDLYTYSNVDTSLTSSQANGYSASFLNASYRLYSRVVRLLQYSGTTNTLSAAQYTLPYYVNNRNFSFDAGNGSLDQYGLLRKSNLNSNPLNLVTINNSAIWEPSGTYNWKIANEATLYDDMDRIIESRDANNRFKATRYGYKNYYVNSQVSNCNYSSYTFADFENAANSVSSNGTARFDGDILATNYTQVNYSTITPHTGSKCISISSSPLKFISSSSKSPGNSLDMGLLPGRIYRASVWVNTSNLSNALMSVNIDGTINGTTNYSNAYSANSTNNLVTTIGNWNLLQLDFEVPEGFSTGSTGQFKIELKSNGGTVYYDDFIFCPVESDFSASVYNPRNGRLLSSIDVNGMATNYVYDASGRPTEVWQEIAHATSTAGSYKQTRKKTYNYARGANN